MTETIKLVLLDLFCNHSYHLQMVLAYSSIQIWNGDDSAFFVSYQMSCFKQLIITPASQAALDQTKLSNLRLRLK